MSDTHPSKLKRGIVKRFLRKTEKVFKTRFKSKSRPSPIASPSCNRSSSLSAPQAEPSSQNKPFENIQLPAQTSKVSALSLDQGASVAQSGPKAASVTTQPTIESKEKNGGKSWKALATALHALHKTSKPLPMLQSVVGTLVPCLDTLQAAAKNRQDFEALALDLAEQINVLEKHLRNTSLQFLSDGVSNVIQSIETEVEYIDKKRKQRAVQRITGVDKDAENLIQCYRRIEGLFRRLQTDANLSTWSIANEQLANTRLETMSPAKLASYNSALSVSINRRTCTENTRLAILSGLNDWSSDLAGAKFYWMSGMAGTGKTTIACTKCETLERHKQLGASFFCTRTSPECRSAKRIVPTIAYQLARYSRPFQVALCRALEKDPDISTRKFSIQFESLLKGPLLEVEEAIPENVVVVIDALDECDDSEEVRMFLTELFRVAKYLPLKFLVTSRPEPEIREQMLSHTENARSVLHLHEIERSLVQADIELYLKEELAPLAPSNFQIRRLAELSGNLFIYAATVVRYIRSKKKSTNPTQRLQAMLSVQSGSSKRYAEIDGLYIAILDAALDEEELEDTEAENVRLVLWTAVCVREPVTIETLSTLAGITQEEVESVLQSLRSVLYVSEGSGLVSTLHASFPDFILGRERSGRFFCDEKTHGQVMARQCFGITRAQLRFNICNLNVLRAIGSATYPVGGISIKSAIVLDGSAKLDQVNERWIDWTPEDAIMASYTQQFLIGFSSNPVCLSTPHIYISALPFCLKSNAVHTRYWNRTKGLIDVTGTALTRTISSALASWDTGAVVKSIAISPDGGLIAFGGPDGKIGTIDRSSGALLARPFRGHTDSVRSLAFSPDGTRIVSGSTDKTVWVWNVPNGAPAFDPFIGHSGKIHSVAFSPDGKLVVSGSRDKTVRLWDAHNGTIFATLEGHTDWVRSVAFSPDGTLVASCSYDKSIRVWNVQDKALVVNAFKGHTDWIRTVAFSPDSSRIVSGSSDLTVRVQNTRDGTLTIPPFEGHTEPLRSVVFSPDGTLIASAACDKTVLIWNAYSGTLFADPFLEHTDRVRAAVFSPGGTEIISGSRDRTIRVWKIQPSADATPPSKVKTTSITSVAFSPDGKIVISGSQKHTLSIWNARDGTLHRGPLKGHSGQVNSVSVSPNSELVTSGSEDQTVCVWDVRDGTLAAPPFKGHTGPIHSVTFSPDGMNIASGSEDKTIRLWKTQDGALSADPFTGHTGPVLSVAFSPDGKNIVSGSADRTISIWNVQDAKLENLIKGHTDRVTSVAFSPDGNRIVSGSQDRTIRVWNVAGGTLVSRPFKGHSDWIQSVAFSPDGLSIVSGSDDCTIRLWSTEDGKPIVPPFKGHSDYVHSVAFSPDGTRIVSGSGDGTIRIVGIQKSSNSTPPLAGDWQVTESGWVINAAGQRLFFVPPEIHNVLRLAPHSLVIGNPYSVQVNCDDLDVVLGDQWSRCFVTEA
ncbi:Notchless protein [Ceratobasidium theobromae]|uniref:Notchless protein n=1 Tax=Ceratobasidium theobromae TaxID=1582974 RepID=A0A5N5QFH0_9AGAM|nr:Notchless protein [Ceratobasidium theobromae]